MCGPNMVILGCMKIEKPSLSQKLYTVNACRCRHQISKTFVLPSMPFVTNKTKTGTNIQQIFLLFSQNIIHMNK
jgi:hypothetical protein